MMLAAVGCSSVPPDDPEPPSGLFHTAGNEDDVHAETVFGLALAGGGGRNNEAYRWLIARSGGGDFVLLTAERYSDEEDEEYLADMRRLGAVDSITTLTVDSREKAESDEAVNAVRNAELLFIDGGDQTRYHRLWNGTRLQREFQAQLLQARIPIGGTSAGMAVLSELAYLPAHNGVTSAQALSDPFHANMDSLVKGFLMPACLADTVCDTHWSERNRCGRTIAFLARIVHDGFAPWPRARAIACDERTAVCIDGDSQAVVFGGDHAQDYAYFLSCMSLPDRCSPGQPLHWSAAARVWKLRGTEAGLNGFDLLRWSARGGTMHEVNVLEGTLSLDIQTPD